MILFESRFEDVKKRLNEEFEHIKVLSPPQKDDIPLSKFGYLWQLYPNVHNRCSASISHISIMFGVVFFLLKMSIDNTKFEQPGVAEYFYLIALCCDLLLYSALLTLSLRCIKPFALDGEFEKPEDYELAFFDDIALKFHYLMVINKGTFLGITVSVLLLLYLVVFKYVQCA